MPSSHDPIAIDVNADLGEGPGEEPLYALVTSASIACGGHAGDAASMRRAIALCLARGVVPGAHPSYPDRERFGRVSLRIEPTALVGEVAEQIAALAGIAAESGAVLAHVKPHGALYNDAADDPGIAEAVARAAAAALPQAILVGRAGSTALDVWRRLGFRVASEAFADRGYLPDGRLRSRREPGALIVAPTEAAAQAVRLARLRPDTLCVHSDTPGAARILAAVREALVAAGFRLAPLASTRRGT